MNFRARSFIGACRHSVRDNRIHRLNLRNQISFVQIKYQLILRDICIHIRVRFLHRSQFHLSPTKSLSRSARGKNSCEIPYSIFTHFYPSSSISQILRKDCFISDVSFVLNFVTTNFVVHLRHAHSFISPQVTDT